MEPESSTPMSQTMNYWLVHFNISFRINIQMRSVRENVSMNVRQDEPFSLNCISGQYVKPLMTLIRKKFEG